jgi:hypothetical protein
VHEGQHARFDKPWSKMNKFIANNGFLKLGVENIAHEYLYWVVADILSFDILVSRPLLLLECSDLSKFKQNFYKDVKFDTPIYGILTQYIPNVESGWGQTKYCYDVRDDRAWKVMVVDFLLGHSDRPANCHRINNTVYAIDNDGASVTKTIDTVDNGIQRSILHYCVHDRSTRYYVLARLKDLPLMDITFDELQARMSVLITCDSTLRSHIIRRIDAIIWRRDQLMKETVNVHT